jgi:hypothetical protein
VLEEAGKVKVKKGKGEYAGNARALKAAADKEKGALVDDMMQAYAGDLFKILSEWGMQVVADKTPQYVAEIKKHTFAIHGHLGTVSGQAKQGDDAALLAICARAKEAAAAANAEMSAFLCLEVHVSFFRHVVSEQQVNHTSWVGSIGL